MSNRPPHPPNVPPGAALVIWRTRIRVPYWFLDSRRCDGIYGWARSLGIIRTRVPK